MLKPGEKLRQAVQDAGDTVRKAAEGTGKLVIAALAVASGALLLAAAALFLVLRWRPSVTGQGS